MGIGDHDLQVGLEKRRVIVAAVPENQVRFLLGTKEDGFVIDSGINHGSVHDVGFVLLALLERALVFLRAGKSCEPLTRLVVKIGVGHRKMNAGRMPAEPLKLSEDMARNGTLAA